MTNCELRMTKTEGRLAAAGGWGLDLAIIMG